MSAPYLADSLGGEELALPLSAVREVLPWVEPRAIPTDRPYLIGVISLRGVLLGVHDISAPMRLTSRPTVIVVAEGPQG